MWKNSQSGGASCIANYGPSNALQGIADGEKLITWRTDLFSLPKTYGIRAATDSDLKSVMVSLSVGTMVGIYGTSSWKMCRPCAVRQEEICANGVLKTIKYQTFHAYPSWHSGGIYYADVYQDLVLVQQ